MAWSGRDRDDLDRVGYMIRRGLLAKADIADLRQQAGMLLAQTKSVGRRHLLAELPALSKLLRHPLLDNLVARLIGPAARSVRSLLFDKTQTRNWSVPWHQDRSIAVRAKAAVPGFERWTVKAGILHVEPPPALLERMVTLRIHLDEADADSGPLLVLPGSHRFGRLDQGRLNDLAASTRPEICTAAAGDILVMRPLLVHASRRRRSDGRRLVLQIEFSGEKLPAPLDWYEAACPEATVP